MRDALKKLIVKYLRDTADKIDAGNCELSSDEASDIMSVIAHKTLSKESACRFLNCSRPKFDRDIQFGKLPKGRKRSGFNELVWYEDELRNALKR